MGCWLGLRALKKFYFYFGKVAKNFKKSIEKIFAKNLAGSYEEKLIIGTFDAWSMRRSSQQPRDQAY